MSPYRHNSTIRIKNKICNRCGLPKPIFSKGRCVNCARIEDALERMDDETETFIKQDGLKEFVQKADDIFSRWLRMSGADEDGIASCYTCDVMDHWSKLQCGHYIKRGSLFLRFDPRNCRIQCITCNVFLDGNYPEYTKRLEAERPGIVEYLLEESRLVQKISAEDVRGVINEYTQKLKHIKNGNTKP